MPILEATVLMANQLKLATKFWVYTHDLDGDIIRDYGDFDDRLRAEMVAITVLDTAGFNIDTMVVRLVDATDPANATTIWMAAPMAYVNNLPKE